MFTIYKKGYFESAHKLEGHPKCGKLHGHSYKYEVWIDSQVIDDKYYFVLDFSEIKNYFNKFDHSGKVIDTSAEDIASGAVSWFEELVPEASKIKVRIWETESSYAEYES